MTGEDALLVVEVADTTLRYDRDIKVPRYAATGVPEVRIEDLKGDRLFDYRDPDPKGFQTSLILKRGEFVFAQAFPEVAFTIDKLLG